MFGAGLEQILAQMMQQNLMGMQGKQQPPQARFSGPMGNFGLLAQQLAGGPQFGQMQQPLQMPQMPQMGRKQTPGLLGRAY
jgi:hypothetical protein